MQASTAKTPGRKTVTSTMYGLLRERVATRQEFLSLIGAKG